MKTGLTMRKKLVAGNWKMHGSRQFNKELLSTVLVGVSGLNCQVVVCPPSPYLAQVADLLAGSVVSLGAQNLCEYASGAYTGEVSAGMLADLGCMYVLVGHSERRTLYGETDDQVARKCEAALANGLRPILCVGETLAEREAGQTESVVCRQLAAVMERLGVEGFAGLLVAYEPVWAIGTGLTATPEQAQGVHRAIRSWVAGLSAEVAERLLILYGGSVKAQNAAALFSQADIDGGLIGGAALVAADFVEICRAAAR